MYGCYLENVGDHQELMYRKLAGAQAKLESDLGCVTVTGGFKIFEKYSQALTPELPI